MLGWRDFLALQGLATQGILSPKAAPSAPPPCGGEEGNKAFRSCRNAPVHQFQKPTGYPTMEPLSKEKELLFGHPFAVLSPGFLPERGSGVRCRAVKRR
jgi:hypothetical protein